MAAKPTVPRQKSLGVDFLNAATHVQNAEIDAVLRLAYIRARSFVRESLSKSLYSGFK